MEADGQAEAIEALRSGRAIGEPGPLARIDTHLSRVFLGRGRAYKLKRAVRMPFVDFSTLEQRRRACLEEVEVNRRFAPRLYLGAEPLARSPDGSLRLGGPGPAVEWVVVMRRFPDGALLDEMATAGTLARAHVAEAADAIARAHRQALPVTDPAACADYGVIAATLARTEADGAAAHGRAAGPAELYDRLQDAAARLAPLVGRRRAEGRARRGHGDLHLRNLCLFEGEVVAFDALEFDPRLATADVLYDLAFLLMDLVHRGLDAHANAAMNRYFDLAGEPAGALALLPMFMALRAAVRCAVAMEAGRPDEAEAYRNLGLRLLEPATPRLLAVGGLSGSGKSVLARELAPELPGPCGARWLRTDVLRKPPGAAEVPLPLDAYAPERRIEVYRRLADEAAAALAAGSSALADASFQQDEARELVRAAARGFGFDALWLRASPEVRAARAGARGRDASDATAAVALSQHEPVLEPWWRIVDAEGSPAEVAAAARAVL